MAERSRWKWLWYELFRRIAYSYLRLFHRARCTGAENLPAEGPVVVIVNHQSHLDPPLIGSSVRRHMSFFARQGLFRFGPFGWFIASLDAIPVDVDGLGLSGVRESLRRLKRGEALVIFAEGKRCYDGDIQSFLPGFTALARRGKAPIVPVALEGPYFAWPRHWRFPWPGGIIHAHFGTPIPAEDVQRMSEKELIAEVEARVRQHHAELCRLPDLAKQREAGMRRRPE